MESNESTRMRIISLVAGGLVLLIVGLVVGLGMPTAMSNGMPPQLGGAIGGLALLFLPVAYSYGIGNFGENARQRVRNRALAFVLGFGMAIFGYVISIIITLGTYDEPLLLLAALMLAVVAYTSTNLWRTIIAV